MAPAKTTVVSDTNDRTGLKCFAFTVLSTAVFTTCTGLTNVGSTSFPTGLTIYGNFSAITLASGTIVIYEA